MPLSLFESVVGGIGLFLLGMRFMSDGMRTVADDRVRSVFAALTANRIYALSCGIFLSLLLNSANAAAIFAIGLANAGILTLYQTLSVCAGILIGAALTLHLHWIPYGLLATPLIFTGVLLKQFARRRKLANFGNLLLGSGLLFFGLTLLETCFSSSASVPFYSAFQGAFFSRPIPATLFGAVLSSFVQSTHSSAVAISSLAMSHHIPPPIASTMILGGIAGVAAIASLASIGGTSVAHRAAASLAAVTLAALLPLVLFAPELLDMVEEARFVQAAGKAVHANPLFNHLAWVHTCASLLTALLLTTLSGIISRRAGKAAKQGRFTTQEPAARFLDMRILNTPTLAIEQARKEILRMAAIVRAMYADTGDLLFEFDARRAAAIRQQEQVLDSLNHEITSFLAALAHTTSSAGISYEIPGMLQTVTDLEHLGDSCETVLNCIMDRKEGNVIFSDEAMQDLRRLTDLVGENVEIMGETIRQGKIPDHAGHREFKQAARELFDLIKHHHFDRISSGVCPPRAAMLFNEFTAAFVRIAELCWNIDTVQERKQSK